MYLNYLKENEKLAFLKIAHIVALSDGDFGENEKIIIGSYCNEMEMENIEFDINNTSIDLLSEEFETVQSKKIVILELMSIVYADNDFSESEKETINKLIKNFSIDSSFLDDVKIWSQALLNIIKQGENLVLIG